MVERSDASAGMAEEPARLFSCDPELARIRPLLECEEPPDGAAERVLAKIGGAGRSPEGWRPTLKLALVAGAALLAVASSEVAHTARPTTPGVSSVAPVQATSTSPASSAPNPPVADSVPIATVHIDDLPSARKQTASPRPSSADDLAFELALVEQARVDLAKGRGRDCLDVVARYRMRFSNKGHFMEEIEVMRIEALAMAGERAAAHAQAARFLEQHGESPYAERVRRVLDETAGEP